MHTIYGRMKYDKKALLKSSSKFFSQNVVIKRTDKQEDLKNKLDKIQNVFIDLLNKYPKALLKTNVIEINKVIDIEKVIQQLLSVPQELQNDKIFKFLSSQLNFMAN
jgi:hypothetical protein